MRDGQPSLCGYANGKSFLAAQLQRLECHLNYPDKTGCGPTSANLIIRNRRLLVRMSTSSHSSNLSFEHNGNGVGHCSDGDTPEQVVTMRRRARVAYWRAIPHLLLGVNYPSWRTALGKLVRRATGI